MLTKLSPLKADDKKGFNRLQDMLTHIDPCIELTEDNPAEDSSIKDFEKWYLGQFGMPGTPEFEKNIKEFNERFN